MATYNGRAYIDLQIASILAQSNALLRLLVRDDQSSDGTAERLESWAGRDARVRIVRDSLGRLGSAGNFMALLHLAEAPYVMFADQDDIWLSTKVERSLRSAEALESECPGLPLLTVCDAASFEEGLGVVAARTQRAHPTRLEDFLFLNGGLYGCCMLLNRPMVSLVRSRPVGYCAQHDHLTSLVALAFGRVLYVPERLMFYRRHHANVSGGPVTVKQKFINFLIKRTPIVSINHLRGVESFVTAFAQDLRPEQRFTFAAFMAFPSQSKLRNAWMIAQHPFRIYGSRMVLLAKLLYRPLI